MAKRLLDILVSTFGLLAASPILVLACLAVWLQDFRSPFYVAPRVAQGGRIFRMIKLRSMVVDADKSGVDSTSNADMRITRVGRLIRKFKLDELTQLWNVLIGDMSLVGPRPNVERETDMYTAVEADLLTVKPGVTDFASIVFSDEGAILAGRDDPDVAYHQLIRPWKNRLALFYIGNRSLWLDIKLIYLTAVAIFSRPAALRGVVGELIKLGAPGPLVAVARREEELVPAPPPGSDHIVTSRG